MLVHFSLPPTQQLRAVSPLQPHHRLRLVQHPAEVPPTQMMLLKVYMAGHNVSVCVLLCVVRCSDGIDRHRQEWLEFSCSEEVQNTQQPHSHSLSWMHLSCSWTNFLELSKRFLHEYRNKIGGLLFLLIAWKPWVLIDMKIKSHLIFWICVDFWFRMDWMLKKFR